MQLGEAVKAAVSALAGPDRQIETAELEIAVLARSRPRRAFRRIEDAEIAALLA
jgi:proteasome alpha subunit